MNVPGYITHYYDSERKPFMNIMDISPSEREPVINKLNQGYDRGYTSRAFPQWYLTQRKKAEIKIKDQFVKMGGYTDRDSPIYFTLGKSQVWENMYLDRTRFISLNVIQSHPEIFYSLGDSIWCFAESEDPNQRWSNQWFQGTLYDYKDMTNILKRLNIDSFDQQSLFKQKIAFIEAFVWSENVLNELLLFNQVKV
jgi:hypothetical protein